MLKKETSQLLNQAAAEIESLRRTNELQAARLSMFDDLMLVFTSKPSFPSQGMTEDIVWKIKKHIEEA